VEAKKDILIVEHKIVVMTVGKKGAGHRERLDNGHQGTPVTEISSSILRNSKVTSLQQYVIYFIFLLINK
jgi:hypothetical protein